MPHRLLLISQWPHGNSCTWHMMYGYTLLVPTNQRVLNKSSKDMCDCIYMYDCIYVYIHMYTYICMIISVMLCYVMWNLFTVGSL